VNAFVKMIVRVATVGGGWAPLGVFIAHLLAAYVLLLYERWPPVDIPLHFFGGVAIAFFLSRSFHAWPSEAIRADRRALLELLLVGSLTVTAATLWEFAEYICDHTLGTQLQFGLADTMKDMAIGIGGGIAFLLARARQLRVGRSALREVTTDWIRGRAA
jgi:hypothetical protein